MDIGPPEKGETVIGVVPDKLIEDWNKITELSDDVFSLKQKLESMLELLSAKRTIFWNDIRNANERADSAQSRGLSIGVRTQDGEMVVVQFKHKPESPAEAFRAIVDKLRELGE